MTVTFVGGVSAAVISLLLLVWIIQQRALLARLERLDDIGGTRKLGDELQSVITRATHDNFQRTTSHLLQVNDQQRDSTAREFALKHEMIDQSLTHLSSQLDGLNHVIRDLERDRHTSHGELASQLKLVSEHAFALRRSTDALNRVLLPSRNRGQWGERMADDVIRALGFKEGINYRRQQTSRNGKRPDFTFLLANDRIINMDVKFPIDNYMRYCEATTEGERTTFKQHFAKDVRARVKEVVGKDYIDSRNNTLDFVLLFIPNDAILGFINEADHSLFDDALARRALLCSPSTLFAVLAVIRQSVEAFHVNQRTDDILANLRQFDEQWRLFCEKLHGVSKKFAGLHREYDQLLSTRLRQVQRPLDRITELSRGGANNGSATHPNVAADGNLHETPIKQQRNAS